MNEEEDAIARWETEGGFVALPDSVTQRMWDVIRAVAAGHGNSGILQAEAVSIKDKVDKLLLGDVESVYDNEEDE